MTSNEEGNDPTLSLAGLADDVAELRRQVSTLLPLNSKNPDRSYWQRGEKCGFSDPFSGLDFVVSKTFDSLSFCKLLFICFVLL